MIVLRLGFRLRFLKQVVPPVTGKLSADFLGDPYRQKRPTGAAQGIAEHSPGVFLIHSGDPFNDEEAVEAEQGVRHYGPDVAAPGDDDHAEAEQAVRDQLGSEQDAELAQVLHQTSLSVKAIQPKPPSREREICFVYGGNLSVDVSKERQKSNALGERVERLYRSIDCSGRS